MTTDLKASQPTYRACLAHAFRAEFGVCRGEAISRFEDLCLGDIYQLKHPADWIAVAPLDDAATEFRFNRPADPSSVRLTTLARLIFMTTTGHRADVQAAISDGHLYLICEAELQVGPEYVLIDIETCDVDFTPEIVSAPVAPMLSHVREPAEIIPFRKFG